MPFQKGVSGNPSGRPKVLVEVQELARQHTPEALKALSQIVANRKANASARVSAAQVLLDRGWGRPLQQVKLDAAGDFLKLIAGLAEGADASAPLAEGPDALREASPQGHA